MSDSPLPVKKNDEPMFISWETEEERKTAIASLNESFQNSEPVKITRGGSAYDDIATDISVREPFARSHYEAFRSTESIPTKPKEIIKACNQAYRRVGLVRNVIDLMSDFAVQGIRIVHPNPQVERFYQRWFIKVHGVDRSERFLNNLYKMGIAIVKRSTGTLNKARRQEYKRMGGADVPIEKDAQFKRFEIPVKYSFISPLSVDLVSSELASLSGKRFYKLRLSSNLVSAMKRQTKSKEMKEQIEQLPEDIRQALLSKKKELLLDKYKVAVFHYKKDDWEDWAEPMTYAILDDLILLEKMKLADLTALDGTISRVRLWTLGSFEHKIIPSQALVNKLTNILTSNVGGGTIDIVWGPGIELKETGTDVYKFLGEGKYKAVLASIYAGLGIPPTLTGAETASGFTNNFISLKTLVERLNYGRGKLLEFWNEEVRIVQKAMGFRLPATIVFERMTLSDEAAEKALLIQLADRDIISIQTVQERFGELHSLESARMRREDTARGRRKLPKKAGPWHDPQFNESLVKIALDKGRLDINDIVADNNGIKSFTLNKLELDMNQETDFIDDKPSGQPQQGRPRGARDKQKRKQKRVLPRTSALISWAAGAQRIIAEVLTPAYLNAVSKKNLRSLTAEQFQEFEDLKLSVLCKLEPFSDIDKKNIVDLINNGESFMLSQNVITARQHLIEHFTHYTKRKPTIDDIRQIQNYVYIIDRGKANG